MALIGRQRSGGLTDDPNRETRKVCIGAGRVRPAPGRWPHGRARRRQASRRLSGLGRQGRGGLTTATPTLLTEAGQAPVRHRSSFASRDLQAPGVTALPRMEGDRWWPPRVRYGASGAAALDRRAEAVDLFAETAARDAPVT